MKNELKKYGCQYIERAIFVGNKKYAYQFIDMNEKLETRSVLSGVKKKEIF